MEDFLGSAEVADPTHIFEPGQRVRVRPETWRTRWRKPHLRTPGYIFGQVGLVERACGVFADPERAAFGMPAGSQMLYRVRFPQASLWEGYQGSSSDTVDVEIYQHWLEAAPPQLVSEPPSKRPKSLDHGHGHSHGHTNNHDHDHVHEERSVLEQSAVDKQPPERPGQRVARALKEAVLAKGIVSTNQLREAVQRVETMGRGGEGARIVARAWTDPAFKARLAADATAACKELGIEASNNTAPTQLTAVFNSSEVHNLVVCTLCSCYPRSILGMSPAWYKCRSYRARAVRAPREVLAEFGMCLPDTVSVRVHDSTADLRYIVIPARPEHGTEGWTEEQLASLVTRDSMIGVADVTPPPSAQQESVNKVEGSLTRILSVSSFY